MNYQKAIYPQKIRLDASTGCQLKCRSCPTASGQTAKGLGRGFLSFKDFKKFIDKNRIITDVELSNWGEIFLNEELIQIIQYADKKSVGLHAGNGANLNNVSEETLEALVKYKFRFIICSIDGASQETYSIYRANGNFQKIIENIKTINKYKDQYRSRYPRLKWQFIAFGHNEHEITRARKMAEELNMEFHVKLSWGDLYDTGVFSPVKNLGLVRKESGLGVASREEYREKYGEEYVLRSCCLEMWKSPQINYDGRVLGCSLNHWADYGNAFKYGLLKSINNEKINYAREMLMGRSESKEGVPCTNCKYYKKMKENNDWITAKEVDRYYVPNIWHIMIKNEMLKYSLTNQIVKELGIFKHYLYKMKKKAKQKISLSLFARKRCGRKLTSSIYPLQLPLVPDMDKVWKYYPIFNGFTKGLGMLSCHASVLTHGQSPHPPHTHEEEEMLLLLNGEIDIIFREKQNSDQEKRISIQPGQFSYYPVNFAHTLETISTQPANYMMLKWKGGLRKNDKVLPFNLFNSFDFLKDTQDEKGFRPRLVVQGQTNYLNKFHCHTSTLSPKAGYEPHDDSYDVVIIVLEGEVETLGQCVGPCGVIFYAAGEPHGIRNPGDITAKYLVFEFHT